ncbi:MAG TPA: hypothetical protein VIV55_00415 [Flavobacterium sp.]
MNNNVLEKYKIKFEIIIRDGRKKLDITSRVIPYFSGYFIKVYPEFLENEIIPEINNAIAGHSFDDDAGGVYDYLKIGHLTSYFYTDEDHQFPIPTLDLKEIILSYIEWIDNNNLEKFI